MSPITLRAGGARMAVGAAGARWGAPARSALTLCAAAVKFTLPKRVEFGQEVAVIGAAEALGKWDAGAALAMTWTEGDVWTAEAEVPAGATEYKYIIRAPGSADVVEWQPCENLVIDLPEAATSAAATDAWEGAHEVDIAAAPEAAAAGPAAGAASAAAAGAGKPAASAAAPEAKAAAAAAPAAAAPAAAAGAGKKAAGVIDGDSAKAAAAVAAAAEVLAAVVASMDDGGDDAIMRAAKAAAAAAAQGQ